MSAEIMEKANELAESIADSSELEIMRQAEIIMNNNPEAVKILEEFQSKQHEVYNIQMGGQGLSEQDKKEIEAIELRMSDNSYIKAYIEASEKFEQLLRGVNLIISRAISGNQGCGCGSSCDPDCGDDCGPSCGCN